MQLLSCKVAPLGNANSETHDFDTRDYISIKRFDEEMLIAYTPFKKKYVWFTLLVYD